MSKVKDLLSKLEDDAQLASSKEMKLYMRAHLSMTLLYLQRYEAAKDRKVRIRVKKLLRELQLEMEIGEMLG